MILKSKILILAFGTVILLSCQKAGQLPYQELEQAPELGGLAPSIRLSDLNGDGISLAGLKGRVVLVNF